MPNVNLSEIFETNEMQHQQYHPLLVYEHLLKASI